MGKASRLVRRNTAHPDRPLRGHAQLHVCDVITSTPARLFLSQLTVAANLLPPWRMCSAGILSSSFNRLNQTTFPCTAVQNTIVLKEDTSGSAFFDIGFIMVRSCLTGPCAVWQKQRPSPGQLVSRLLVDASVKSCYAAPCRLRSTCLPCRAARAWQTPGIAVAAHWSMPSAACLNFTHLADVKQPV